MSVKWYFNRIKSYLGRPRTVNQIQPIYADEIERCKTPIFIVGAHRSGTTLVRRMMNSHPKVACPPETFFIMRYCDMMKDDLVQAGFEGFGYDRNQMREYLAKEASALHEAFRTAQAKPIWADKTPRYTEYLNEIDELFDGSPRYLLVLRHPCDVAFSVFKRGWRFVDDEEDAFKAAVIYVRRTIDKLKAFELAHPDRCVVLVYEDLVENPAQVWTDICPKLGIEYHAEMLDFASRDHNYGIEDPVIRGTKKIQPSHGGWKSLNEVQRAFCELHFGPEIRETNYWKHVP